MVSIRKLSGSDLQKIDKIKTAITSFLDVFGVSCLDKSNVISNIPDNLKYSDEYINEIFPLLYPDDSRESIFNILFKTGGYYYYGVKHNKVIEYIAKNHKEDIPQLLTLIESDVESGNYRLDDVNEIFTLVNEFNKYLDTGEKSELSKFVFNSKLLDYLYKCKKDDSFKYIDNILINVEDPSKYVDSIKSRFPLYTNFPVVLFNDNIERTERIKFIKKTFIQKNICKYMTVFQEKLKDFSLLDDFITAVVTENARVKEKSIATRDILERFFLGMNDSRRWYQSELTCISGFSAFMKKYARNMPLEYVSRIYSGRYTKKNKNIETYISLYIHELGTTPVEKIRLAQHAPSSLVTGLVRENFEFKPGTRISEFKDMDILKEVIKYDCESAKVFAVPYNMLLKGYSNSVLIGNNDYLCDLINTYPELCEKFFEETIFSSKNQHSYYSTAPLYRDFINNYFIPETDYNGKKHIKIDEKFLYKFKMLPDNSIKKFFFSQGIGERYNCADEFLFVKGYLSDMLDRLLGYKNNKNDELFKIADESLKAKLTPFIDSDNVSEMISSIADVIGNKSYDFASAFTDCSSNKKSVSFNIAFADMISTINNLASILAFTDEERTAIKENLNELNDAALLLLNI